MVTLTRRNHYQIRAAYAYHRRLGGTVYLDQTKDMVLVEIDRCGGVPIWKDYFLVGTDILMTMGFFGTLDQYAAYNPSSTLIKIHAPE